jgi:hypothetical protein
MRIHINPQPTEFPEDYWYLTDSPVAAALIRIYYRRLRRFHHIPRHDARLTIINLITAGQTMRLSTSPPTRSTHHVTATR